MTRLVKPRSPGEIPVIVATDPADDLLATDRTMVLSQFTDCGALLFRSFRVGIDKFQAIVTAYSGNRISYPGRRRSAVSGDRKVQTVSAGLHSIPLHSELSHTPFRPDICWFYCVRAPGQGSQTTLCDGAELAARLPDPVRDLLDGRLLRYSRTRPIGYLEQLLGTTDRAAVRAILSSPAGRCYRVHGDRVRQDFLTPALGCGKFVQVPVFANNILHNFRRGRPMHYPTFEDGGIIPEALIVQIRQIARRCTLEIEWRDEDVLMFDNTRFMHGRRPIVDPNRIIWTQFSDAAF
jgi:Taurine catabolism dioxygenase TauD, TfdA family